MIHFTLLGKIPMALAFIAMNTTGGPSETLNVGRDAPMASNPASPILYDAPEGEPPSDLYTVKVNGQPLFVYQARVSAKPLNRTGEEIHRPLDQTEWAAFAYFDMAGPVEMEVTSTRPVEDVTIRPLSRGIESRLKGDSIAFRLEKPGPVVVEINGDHHALHLFANPPEDSRPRADDPSVKYYGPGFHDIGRLRLESGETAYIAGGAVVRGAIYAKDAGDVRILGRGILDGSMIPKEAPSNLINFTECRDVEVTGIILRDPPSWTALSTRSETVRYANVKIIGAWRYNSDGINFVDCRDVRVADCFVRSYDDSIAIKSFQSGGEDVYDVIVENCVIWTDWGISLGVTYETRAPRMRDILFRQCDVLHNMACRAALTINPNDSAEVSDVRFENIRVEDARSGLIEVVVEKTKWAKDPDPGTIRDVSFRDIAVTGGPFPPSFIRGFDPEHGVADVAIENLTIHGKPILNAADGQFEINPYVKNVTFRATESP